VVQKGQIHIEKRVDVDPVGTSDKASHKPYVQLHTTFNILQLICWSIEIAQGMQYLAMKKVGTHSYIY